MEVVKENVNSRLLVSTLNKTNKNELIVVRTNCLIVEPIVLRKVNTLMEVRNIKEEFKKAALEMEDALKKMEKLLKKMEGEQNEND